MGGPQPPSLQAAPLAQSAVERQVVAQAVRSAQPKLAGQALAGWLSHSPEPLQLCEVRRPAAQASSPQGALAAG
jgi:hypothetical protein